MAELQSVCLFLAHTSLCAAPHLFKKLEVVNSEFLRQLRCCSFFFLLLLDLVVPDSLDPLVRDML